ncbi:MAG: MATE family efflux transporter, partial [Crocinitomicaceae bacterium]|nr:MATE family efflux transporter [Crocinitomicaceae bacterium]
MKKLLNVIRLSFSDQDFDFTTLSIKSSIVILAIPMIIEMLMESVFAVVDIFFVGRLGKEALATVGLTESVLMIVYSIGMGVSMAATALVARRFGEKKYKEAGTSAFQLIATGGIIALVISIGSFFFAENLLGLMGASEAVVAYGKGYTQIIFASNIVIVLLFLINGIFRGAGNAQLAMRTLIIANGINIVLDPILIFGIGSWDGFGLKGAAIATTIGRGIGVGFQCYQIFNGKHLITIARENIAIKWQEIKKILSISAGGMGQFLIDSVSWILLSRLIASFGDTAIAGYTVAFRVIVFTILPAWG